MAKFEDLLGQTLVTVESYRGSSFIYFTTTDSSVYCLYHEQDCCETVVIDDIVGDISDLLKSPILLAEEVTDHFVNEGNDSSHTWTFYKLSTIKGSVTIKWLGTSNGHYSERVSFKKIYSGHDYK